jgi:hypothetical protein
LKNPNGGGLEPRERKQPEGGQLVAALDDVAPPGSLPLSKARQVCRRKLRAGVGSSRPGFLYDTRAYDRHATIVRRFHRCVSW